MNDASSVTSRAGKLSILKRILVVIAVIVIYRLGASVVIPGAGGNLESLSPEAGGTLNLFNLFSGGPLTSASLFALGVTPFITSAIAMQLLESVVPAIKETKKQGKAGTTRINSLTRIIAVVLGAIQSWTIISTLQGKGIIAPGTSPVLLVAAFISLVVGFLVLLWLAEIITQYGIGNGVTVLLVVSILSSVWDVSNGVIMTQGVKTFFLTVVVLVVLTIILVCVSRAERRLPIIHASRHASSTQHLSYLPFKLIHGGVAPVIFATSLLGGLVGALALTPLAEFAEPLKDRAGVAYIIITALLIVGFVRLYERTSADPVEMANELMKNSSFIPGVRPGWSTAAVVENTSLRLAAVSCLVLVPVALMDSFALRWFDIPFFPLAGMSLMILVTAILDIIRQAKSISTLYNYEELAR